MERPRGQSWIKRAARAVSEHSILVVVPVAFLLLFPSSWMGVGFAAALVPYATRWIACSSPVPVTKVNLPLLALLLMTAVGLVYSSASDLALLTVGEVVASVTVFYALVDRIRKVDDLWRVCAGIAILGILLALVAPFTVEWSGAKLFGLSAFYDQVWPRLPKATNANILAGALAPIVPLALALAMKGERRWRILGAVALAPLGLILVLLQSRGALFALAVGLAVWATLYRKWVLPIIPIALLGVLAFNQRVGGPPPAQLFYGKIGTVTGGTLFERQDMWRQSLELIAQSPVLGIGLGAYPRVAPYAPPYSPAHPGMVENHTHDLFLQVALDTGVVGLAGFIAILALSIYAAWRAFRQKVETHLAIGLLASFVVVVIHGLGDTAMWGSAKSSVVLWMLFALATRLDKVKELV
ncbi:MAG: O-antigen ligase family protein [Chloroflexi bacterium]|nr:O-antigen ligase family protein [Chloroflexota bacterium]